MDNLTAAESELPFDGAAQRRVELALSAALSGKSLAGQVRPVVLDSWSRSVQAGVSVHLKQAPLVWNDDQLHFAREHSDWFPAAQQTLARQRDDHLAGGHVITLFDSHGRMLLSEGDPAAREGLSEMNFRPGAQWSEDRVGTNGPGTALALGRPVHVVGAEHFCEKWHPWHCAAAPVRDPSTGEIVAVVDISGFREMGHPHTLRLSSAIAAAIEQRLAVLDAERRVLLLQQFAQLAGRWPGEAMLAVDRAGSVVASSHDLPAGLSGDPGRERLRALLARAAAHAQDRGPEEVTMPVSADLVAVCRPIFDGRAHAGSCLVLRPSHPKPQRAHHHNTHYTLEDVVGVSQKVTRARETARAAARTALPVLLSGESGTGKEVFAQGIHAASPRAAKRFVGVNCASLSRELVESEFFGYVGGAFSGARREGSIGKFEAADGGTLFLDEIAELSGEAQAALLRALQEGEVVPVGGNHARPIDVRVIAATNRDIHACLSAGTLREDLFHRLNVLAIQLPPLRERLEDLPLLAERFLRDAEQEQGRAPRPLDPELLAALQLWRWPGNVRELKNVMRRLVALAQGETLTLADAPEELRGGPVAPEPASAKPETHAEPHENAALKRLVDTVASAQTMTEAAALLGVTRSTLYRQLARFGLRPERILRKQ
ncbi:MAG TPA: sigma-54-dependent Fis family transcriptional regulator [Myxococcales bacterium]|jgi:transcriptional regulator of acetoin/glycerol metabolism|nr:sigma-54-dependent Fis family transcriptional regulator [Myxococcales bacterium]